MAEKEKNQEVETKEEEEKATTEQEEVSKNTNSSEVKENDELEKCKEELKAWEDKYLRMYAEFENIKKRMEREKENSVAYAQEQFARDLLPVIDSLELALSSISDIEDESCDHLAKLKEGVQLTLEQFIKTFEKHYIKVVEIDSGFDPNFHDAVMQVDSDEHESGQIVQVLQKGYMYKKRLLRPAMVSVAK